MVKGLPAMQRPVFDPWVWKIPWRRAWQLTPVFLSGEFPRGQRSLVGYSSWGHKSWTQLKWLSTHTHLAPISPYYNCNRLCAVLSWFSRVWLFATLWTVARQAPLSMGFSRQEYWSELSCPPPGGLPDPRIEPMSLTFPALAAGFFTTSSITWEVTIFAITEVQVPLSLLTTQIWMPLVCRILVGDAITRRHPVHFSFLGTLMWAQQWGRKTAALREN